MEIGKKSVEGLSQKGRGRMQRDDRDGTYRSEHTDEIRGQWEKSVI